jgi:hypothetical protein
MRAGALGLQRVRREETAGAVEALDCAPILIMEEQGIADALAHDHHVEQAEFKALLRD